MIESALQGLHVLDLSTDMAGQYCARLFADNGADVVLIEPEAGHPLRAKGPFDRDGASLALQHLTQGKRRVSPSEARGLLSCSDVVVAPAEQVRALQEELSARAVLVGVSTFGVDGPFRDWKGPEIVVQALSGMMNNNGQPGRPPLFGVGERASYAAGVAGYAAALAALLARDGVAPGRGSGRGQVVEVDVVETAAAMCFPYVMQYAYNGTDRRRGDQDIPAMQVHCRGIWICIWIYPFRFAAMCKTLGLDHLTEDPRFARAADRSANWADLTGEVQRVLHDADAEDVVARLQEAQVIAAVAYRPGELIGSPHLQARNYWRTVQTENGPRMALGPAFRLSASAQSHPSQRDGVRRSMEALS